MENKKNVHVYSISEQIIMTNWNQIIKGQKQI